jgi:hypothetical protein
VQIGAELADKTLFTFAGGAVHDSMLLDSLVFIDENFEQFLSFA